VLKFVFIIDAVADLTQKGKSELKAYVRDFSNKGFGSGQFNRGCQI